MAEVVITDALENEINRHFQGQSVEIFELLHTLGGNPKKGDVVGAVGGVVIKELKYGAYRFYFITDAYKVKFLKSEELTGLIIKFVRMSRKNDQQKVIEKIKNVLRLLGKEGF